VPPQERRLQVGEVGHRGERTVELVRLDRQHRCRLGVEDPRARVVADLGEPAFAVADEGIHNGWVIAVTPPVGKHIGGCPPAGPTRP